MEAWQVADSMSLWLRSIDSSVTASYHLDSLVSWDHINKDANIGWAKASDGMSWGPGSDCERKKLQSQSFDKVVKLNWHDDVFQFHNS